MRFTSRSFVVFVFCLSSMFPISATAGENGGKDGLVSFKDKASYAIGARIGSNMKRDRFDLNPDLVAEGMKDALNNRKLRMELKEITTILMKLQEQKQAAMKKKRDSQQVTNKKEGEKFLAANKNKKGVITTPSGLQYEVIKEGDGPKPTAADNVKVHYKGTLLDGEVFDSSYDRGEPISFPLNGVIPGWTEGLQLMKVGSKYRFFIPSNLAYGERGAGAVIGPNATLIFEVELLGIGE